ERNRKLLLHRRELDRLRGKIKERGLTLIPLRLYWVKGRAKAELGLGRGKKLHDKREAIRERMEKRDLDRAMAAGRRRRGPTDELRAGWCRPCGGSGRAPARPPRATRGGSPMRGRGRAGNQGRRTLR